MFLEVTLAETGTRGRKKTLNLMQIASIEQDTHSTKIVMHHGGGQIYYVNETYDSLISLIAEEGLLIRLA